MISKEDLINTIVKEIPSAQIVANDMTGGGDHWQLKIVAEEFRTCSLIEQHQLVYKALGSLMDKEIHALSLDTSAP